MYLLDVTAVLVATIAVIAVVNALVLRMPPTIGVTIGGLMVSVGVAVLSRAGFGPAVDAAQALAGIDFDQVVFLGVLSFLLFAGALFLDSHELWRMRWPVLVFALFSTLISTGLVGGAVYLLLDLIGVGAPLVHCLLFGSLISPTDPVAVLGMLKHARVPSRIETLIAGESLFNDGIGVVLFTVLSLLAVGTGGEQAVGAAEVAGLFAQDALGGLALGVACGAAGLLLMRLTSDYVTDVLISLAVVTGLTAIAFRWHVSAPLAAVAAGLLVGSLTDRAPRTLADPKTFENFWHLVDELLNLFLFALLAFDLVLVTVTPTSLVAALGAVVVVLAARAVSVALPAAALARGRPFDPYTRRLMVWGGLRGALAVALAFTLPASADRDLFLVMTYAVVLFSLIVQGLTVGRIAARAGTAQTPGAADRPAPA